MDKCTNHHPPSSKHCANEHVLINSVICSKKVLLVAKKKVELKVLKEVIGYKLHEDISFSPNPSTISLKFFLFKDVVVIMGFIKGTLIIDGICVKKIVLPFQVEVKCEGICPRDKFTFTPPLIEGIIPPQVFPGDDLGEISIIIKVLLETQITVSKEKIVKSLVEVIGDIDEKRCIKQEHKTVLPIQVCIDSDCDFTSESDSFHLE